jgi:hypothetical protein
MALDSLAATCRRFEDMPRKRSLLFRFSTLLSNPHRMKFSLLLIAPSLTAVAAGFAQDARPLSWNIPLVYETFTLNIVWQNSCIPSWLLLLGAFLPKQRNSRWFCCLPAPTHIEFLHIMLCGILICSGSTTMGSFSQNIVVNIIFVLVLNVPILIVPVHRGCGNPSKCIILGDPYFCERRSKSRYCSHKTRI